MLKDGVCCVGEGVIGTLLSSCNLWNSCVIDSSSVVAAMGS